MGFFSTKMTVDEAEKVLIYPTETDERFQEAYKVFFSKLSSYNGKDSFLVLQSLALFRGADSKKIMSKNNEASYNIMSLKLDEEYYESTGEIMRAFPEYSVYLLNMATARENFDYLYDAYRLGWGVDIDSEKAEEYAKKCGNM